MTKKNTCVRGQGKTTFVYKVVRGTSGQALILSRPIIHYHSIVLASAVRTYHDSLPPITTLAFY